MGHAHTSLSDKRKLIGRAYAIVCLQRWLVRSESNCFYDSSIMKSGAVCCRVPHSVWTEMLDTARKNVLRKEIYAELCNKFHLYASTCKWKNELLHYHKTATDINKIQRDVWVSTWKTELNGYITNYDWYQICPGKKKMLVRFKCWTF